MQECHARFGHIYGDDRKVSLQDDIVGMYSAESTVTGSWISTAFAFLRWSL